MFNSKGSISNAYWLLVIVYCSTLTSCLTSHKTASTATVQPQVQNITVADLEVGDRITYRMEPSKELRKGGLENVKRAAEAEALAKYGNADLLVEPRYVYTKRGNKVISMEVSGRPAHYVNFRSLPDTVWGNPVFRGVGEGFLLADGPRKRPRYARGGRDNYASGVKETSSKVAPENLRATGFHAYLDLFYTWGAPSGDLCDRWGESLEFRQSGGASLTLGYQITPRFYVGVGSGAHYISKSGSPECLMVPIYGDVRYWFSRSKYSFFVDARVGGSFEVMYGDTSGGFFVSPAIGYSFGWFDVAVRGQFYQMGLDRYGKTYNGGMQNIGINLGFRF